ncbi:unnamed protein product, partial [Mesorhabditis spiculigera]
MHFAFISIFVISVNFEALDAITNGIWVQSVSELPFAAHLEVYVGTSKPSDVIVRVGDIDPASKNIQAIRASSLHVHPDYHFEEDYAINGKYEFPVNDIALIKLSRRLVFSRNIRPIAIANKNENFPEAGVDARVIGWGGKSGSEGSEKLLCTTVELWSYWHCTQQFPGKLLKSAICAFKKGNGPCEGDSGSPLFLNHNGTRIQIGVVSSGLEDECTNEKYASSYTEVSKFCAWIELTVKEKICLYT